MCENLQKDCSDSSGKPAQGPDQVAKPVRRGGPALKMHRKCVLDEDTGEMVELGYADEDWLNGRQEMPHKRRSSFGGNGHQSHAVRHANPLNSYAPPRIFCLITSFNSHLNFASN